MSTWYCLARKGVVTALTAVAVLAHAQAPAPAADFPVNPIKWIVGYPAGGGSDFLARTVGAQMAIQLGQPILIDNRPGAAANIGADIAAKSPADGYTVFSADNGVMIYNPLLYKKLAYDATKDFAPLGLMARTPLLVVAAPNANIKDAKDLIAQLKANPGKFSYASPGVGSPHHLAMELFKNRLGVFAVHVPYRGAAPALQDLMGGQIPLMMVDGSAGMSAIKSGRAVPLVTLSARRLPQLPNVPTMAELGYKDVEAYAWQGLVVPVKTPKDVQTRLSAEMQAAINNPAVKKKLYDATWDAVPSDSVLMSVYLLAETRVWHKLIKERGISAE